MKRNKISKYLRIIQFVLFYLVIITLIIWFVFIANGFVKLGYLPKYGDPEITLFDNSRFHLTMVIAALYVTFYGTILWIILLFLKFFFKMELLNQKSLLLGSIAFILNFLFLFTSQFEWILD